MATRILFTVIGCTFYTDIDDLVDNKCGRIILVILFSYFQRENSLQMLQIRRVIL